jgi:hypothetical protein
LAAQPEKQKIRPDGKLADRRVILTPATVAKIDSRGAVMRGTSGERTQWDRQR